MQILSRDQLERYMGLMLPETPRGFGEAIYGRLKTVEERLGSAEGLPYVFASLYHIDGESLASIARSHKLCHIDIMELFRFYKIPTRGRGKTGANKLSKKHGERGRNSGRLSPDERRLVLEVYDKNVGMGLDYRSLIENISIQIGVDHSRVRIFLDRYLGVS